MALDSDKLGNSKKASTYKKIDKEEFDECLQKTKLDFIVVDYDWTGELVYEAYSEDKTFTIRVYSSLNKTTGKARSKGSDAIRVVVLHSASNQPVMKQKRVHRIQTFCKNLRKRINNIVGSKDQLSYCPVCDSLMVIRENKKTGNKFFGCTQYPDCHGTRSFK